MRIVANDMFSFSRFGLSIAFAFCMLALGFRATLPFGDEPDFAVRSVELVENEFSAWTPYYWLSDELKYLKIDASCKIVASPTNVMARIEGSSCGEGAVQVLWRTLLMIFIASPVLLLVALRGFGLGLLSLTVCGPRDDLNRRIDAIGLSLLIPGMIFYLGLLSHEQLTLLISLFIFFFWGNWYIVAGLLALIGSLDLGNSIVIATFILMHTLIVCALASLGAKLTYVILGCMLTYFYSVGYESLTHIRNLQLLDSKIDDIINQAQYADFRDKYPLILRPIIIFMTGVFMTPSGIKIIPLYIFYGITLLIFLNRLRHLSQQKNKLAQPFLLSISSTILSFSFILPNYTNAKYYIFMVPFILYLALKVFSRQSIFFYFGGTALMVPFGLMLFREI